MKDEVIASDLKSEIFIIGHLLFADNFNTKYGLSVTFSINLPKSANWTNLSHKNQIQTHTAYNDNSNKYNYNHPFEFYLVPDMLTEFPNIEAKIWRLDHFNRIDLFAVGTFIIPKTIGTHKITCKCFNPSAGWEARGMKLLLNEFPKTNITLDEEQVIGEFAGNLIFEIEIIYKNIIT